MFIILLLILFTSVIFLNESAGFSNINSRITFLSNNSFNKYFAYLGTTLLFLLAPLVSNYLIQIKNFNLTFMFICVLVIILSIISGSKGKGILWVLSVIALLDFKKINFSYKLFISFIIPIFILFYCSIYLISYKLNLPVFKFMELCFARFFLNNDTRALALEFKSIDQSVLNFLKYSFRFISYKLGFNLTDPPIGIILAEKNSGFDSTTGGNASLTALMLYYFPRGLILLPSLLFSCFNGIIFLLSLKITNYCKNTFSKVFFLVFGIVLIQFMSQDVLALPLIFISFLFIIPLFFSKLITKCLY